MGQTYLQFKYNVNVNIHNKIFYYRLLAKKKKSLFSFYWNPKEPKETGKNFSQNYRFRYQIWFFKNI